VKNIDNEDRALRGGSWGNVTWNCRASNRSRGTPDYRNYFLGFRVVLSSPQRPLPSAVLPSYGSRHPSKAS